MPNNVKLYRLGVTFLAADPKAVADWDAPTSDELNKQFDWTVGSGLTVNGKTITYDPDFLVHNITCPSTESDTTFESGDHETNDELGYCDEAQKTELTFSNPSVAFSFWRDAEKNAQSAMNETFSILFKPDHVYYFIMRVGDKASNVPFEAGDLVRIARMSTDNLVDVLDASANVRGTQTTLKNGFDAWNIYLGA